LFGRKYKKNRGLKNFPKNFPKFFTKKVGKYREKSYLNKREDVPIEGSTYIKFIDINETGI